MPRSTWPTNMISGTESCSAMWMPCAALVAPGPRVTMTMPGRPVSRAVASAIIAAPALLPADGDGDRRVVQRVEHREIALARHAEHVLHALRREAIDDELAAGAGRGVRSVMAASVIGRLRGGSVRRDGRCRCRAARCQRSSPDPGRVGQHLGRVLAQARRGASGDHAPRRRASSGERTVGIDPPAHVGGRQVDPHAAGHRPAGRRRRRRPC